MPEHLLPRLHGYELLMAPYAIAHLKIGSQALRDRLPLRQRRAARECARTSARYELLMAPYASPTRWNRHRISPKELSTFAIPALANEAQAVNEIKRDARFTVIIGNPPYSGHSANKGTWIRELLRGSTGNRRAENYFEVDGGSLNERNPKWLNDDYVKFIRLASLADRTHGPRRTRLHHQP